MSRPLIPWPPPPDKRIDGFTPHRDGWAKSYRGKTIVISGKTRTAKDVRERFDAKCRELDAGEIIIPNKTSNMRDLASAFFSSMDYRVEHGTLSPRTRENLIWQCRRFAKFVGGDRLVSAIGPNDFAQYYKRFADGRSPYTAGSLVDGITTMFKFAERNGIVERVIFGDRWAAPKRAARMDRRLRLDKCFTPDELARLWRCADPMWRIWIALGLVCAFTPTDLSHLPAEVIHKGVIDFRRRKTGKMRRIIPLPPEVVAMIDAYKRPRPLDAAFDGFVFLNHKGRPFGMPPRRNEISYDFRLLQEEAGVYRLGRNFTGLRTTSFNAMLKASAMDRALIMGRRPPDMSAIDWENYLEHPSLDSVRALTRSMWRSFKSQLMGDDASEALPLVPVSAALSSASRRGARK